MNERTVERRFLHNALGLIVVRFHWERFSTVPTASKMQERMEIRSKILKRTITLGISTL
jgi:hypothetical protein